MMEDYSKYYTEFIHEFIECNFISNDDLSPQICQYCLTNGPFLMGSLKHISFQGREYDIRPVFCDCCGRIVSKFKNEQRYVPIGFKDYCESVKTQNRTQIHKTVCDIFHKLLT